MLFRSEETGDDLDSYVSKQADRLRECTDCWSMLRKDVVTRQDLALQKGDFFRDTDSEDENEENETSSVVLGKHSWHLLEWFINIFLKDKALSESSEDPSTGEFGVQQQQLYNLANGRFYRANLYSSAITYKTFLKKWRCAI